jgi:hypothetical protein
MTDIKKMNKNALEDYGRTLGIELDRRKTKKDLIKQVEEQITKSDETIARVNEAIKKEAAEEKKVLLRDKNTGRFSKGEQPPGNPTATYGGKPYWEV